MKTRCRIESIALLLSILITFTPALAGCSLAPESVPASENAGTTPGTEAATASATAAQTTATETAPATAAQTTAGTTAAQTTAAETEPATVPVTEPVTDPVTEPVTEPFTDPATEPVTEPVTDPATEPVTEPVTEPAPEPLKKTVPYQPNRPNTYQPAYNEAYERVLTQKKASTSGAYIVEMPSRVGVVYTHRLPFSGSLSYAETREDLIKIVNWRAFYRWSGFSVKLGYPVTDVEEELNYLYRNSGYLPSLCAVFGSLEDDVLTVDLKFYPESYLGAPRYTTKAYYIGVENDPPTGIETFPGLDPENGVSVWDSDQAAYALSQGYAITPIEGSPAETIVNVACEILSELVDDSMTEWQIAYRVYRWLMENAVYDQLEHWAGGVPTDKVYESEMYSARLISFKAEGPLLYGIGACFGFAKASSLLLGLEGIDFTRVVAFSIKLDPGRSCIIPKTSTIAIHSFLYLHIDGYDYIFDPTAVGEHKKAVYDSKTRKNVDISWYRDFCIGLDFQEHRVPMWHYADGDPYANSDEYNPGFFNYLTEFTYDGEHDLLLSSVDEAEHYYNYLLETVFSGTKEFRTVTLFYEFDDGMSFSEWTAQYRSRLVAFLDKTGVPYQYAETDISSNRTIADVQVQIVFGR